MSVSPLKPLSPLDAQQRIETIIAAAGNIVLGKREALRVAVSCLIAGGHLLLEDLPGVGKTTLAQVLARLFDLKFQRIQFTSDLLPADIIGVSIYDRAEQRFNFHKGPVFTQVLLADEVNRATPRAQSSLLEAMEERQVTVEGETHVLPQPFFVIATQNPSGQVGTFPLPESQLDRFLMRISLGYPERAAEGELLRGEDRRDMLQRLVPVADRETLRSLACQAERLVVAEPLLAYIQDLLAFTRSAPEFTSGLSPRAGLQLLRAARVWALGSGRGHVLPEDVQRVFPAVAGHRLQSQEYAGAAAATAAVLEAVPIP